MKVPLLDLKPQLESLHGEILEAVTRVVESTQYIMGPEIEGLEKEIAEYCGTADAVGVSSGTDALLLSLMALDIGPGDIVLTSDFSFFATAGVISRLNATPVFLDIDPDTWNLDPRQVEQKLESMSVKERKRVKAIIVVHLYGQSAEMKPLLDCAESHGIPVIEDAAQAIGAEYELNSTACKVGRKSCTADISDGDELGSRHLADQDLIEIKAERRHKERVYPVALEVQRVGSAVRQVGPELVLGVDALRVLGSLRPRANVLREPWPVVGGVVRVGEVAGAGGGKITTRILLFPNIRYGSHFMQEQMLFY